MLRQPEHPSSFRFSINDVPASNRAKAVCELRERGILAIEPLPNSDLHLDIAKWLLPGVGILSGTLCGLRQEGTPKSVGASDDLFFGVNLAGRSTAIQRGREITFGDGDAVLLSCAERTFNIPRPTPVCFVGLRMPRKRLAAIVTDIDDQVMRVTPGVTDALKLLTGYLRTVLNEEVLASPAIARVVASHLLDLIALSLGATHDTAISAQAGGVRAARLQAIKTDIVANLANSSLTVADIAARHGVTPRYVHKLFEYQGTTFTQFVLRQRLDHAYRMLRDQRLSMLSITSIAFDVGFGDLSYFNRTFRRRYNATPSDIRNEAEN
jgi:AraC-like DNA-binding protein